MIYKVSGRRFTPITLVTNMEENELNEFLKVRYPKLSIKVEIDNWGIMNTNELISFIDTINN